MKNPVMKAIKRCLKLEKKAGFDLKSELSESEILTFMNSIMSKKVALDILSAKGSDVLTRKPQHFPDFVYEQSLIAFGQQTRCNQNLVMMVNGLNQFEESNAYAKILNRLLGMTMPPLRNDEIQVVLKSHQFFTLC